MNLQAISPFSTQPAVMASARKAASGAFQATFPVTETRIKNTVKPSPLHFQAAFLKPGFVRHSVQFGYGPSREELKGIQESLEGWTKKAESGNPQVLGPNYLPSDEIVRALSAALLSKQPVSPEILKQIAKNKLQVLNTHLFLMKKPLLKEDSLQADAAQFLQDLTRKVEELKAKVLTPANGFPPKAREFFLRFVAQTAPIVYGMGFADAMDHCGDVARLSIKNALKNGAKGPEVVQAAVVGWLHDPKLRGDLSWSNLATHPIVASAIAEYVFEQPQIKQSLQAYLQETKTPLTAEAFGKGVAEAISINNDSDFVNLNVILSNGFKLPHGEKGLADVVPEAKIPVWERFIAPSLGQKPQPLPEELLNRIDTVQTSTDLKGISYEAFVTATQGKTENPQALFNQLISGEIQDDSLVSEIRNSLDGVENAVRNPKVKGSTLLSHHDDVRQAPLAALALTLTDPVLLSPHKVVEASPVPTTLGRIKSYAASIYNNIRYLPLSAQGENKAWLRDIYASMVRSADSLTRKALYQDFLMTSANLEIDAQVGQLKTLVEADTTWRSREGVSPAIDFGALQPAQPQDKEAFQTLTKTLKKEFEAAAQASPVIFAESLGQTAVKPPKAA